MKKWILAALLLLAAAASCQKLQFPVRSDDTSLIGLKCFVYYDPQNPSVRQELSLLMGTYNRERGLISYTFPADERFTPAALQRCRIEATIPPTSVLELTDAGGNPLGHGFEGFYDLRGNTLYFRITAADGTVKPYQLTCKSSR
jgi:hypothetical protein